jgi:glutamyl-tRNA synthetase
LAVVADDIVMGVTEVVRGEDLLLSTAKQVLLRRALRDCVRQERAAGRDPALFPAALMEAEPLYYHCPLVRDADGKRMSKRRGSETLRAMREAGRRPEQVRAALFPAAMRDDAVREGDGDGDGDGDGGGQMRDSV